MVNMRDDRGLFYRNLDLHVHTPESDCFLDKSVTPKDIVDTAIRKGLGGIAITDHNSGAWVDRVKEAAGNKLVVFPGVEITTCAGETNVHIIALFDIDKTTKDVENLLGELRIFADKYGKPDAYTQRSPADVIDVIASRHALAIAPHANSSNGIMGGMRGVQRHGVVMNPGLAAVEATHSDFDNAGKKHKKTRVIDLLDGSHPEYTKLAVYQSSDNLNETTGKHETGRIGSYYSCFKLDEVNLEGLRQCFCDPDVRIKLPSDLNPITFPRIRRMEISHGFLADQKITFHDGLNSIIGGKGTGKSLAIELLRFALMQPSGDKELKVDHQKKLEKRLELSGKVTVDFALSTGVQYQVVRIFDSMTNPAVCTNIETGDTYTGDIPSLFPILAYSQNEVIKIAEDEAAQLRLTDSFIDVYSYDETLKELVSSLAKNDRELAASIKASLDAKSYMTQISTVKEQLKSLNKALRNRLFDEMRLLEQKRSLLEQFKKFNDNARVKMDEAVVVVLADLTIPNIPKELATDVEIKTARKLASSTLKNLSCITSEVIKAVSKNEKILSSLWKEWEPTFQAKSKKYEEMLKKAGGDKKKLETERRKHQIRLDSLISELDRLNQIKSKLKPLRTTRSSLLDDFERIHKDYFGSRKKLFDDLTMQSEGKLKLDIQYAGNRESYKEKLWELRARSGIHRADTDIIADKIMPSQFVDWLIDSNVDVIALKSGLPKANVTRIVELLNSAEDLSEILALSYSVHPKDVPSIKFRKDDGSYEPVSDVSTGQKCTALLIIALSEGQRPIVIDQPEDSLDTTSVYDIVAKLRSGKEKRQFILTTHNASVGVASDSDNFIVLRSTSSRGKVDCFGAIDRELVRKEVLQHLEGGPQPYKLRYRKYEKSLNAYSSQ